MLRTIYIYLRRFLSAALPASSCRFSPTCSQYCQESVSKYGIIKGVSLCLHRIVRCNPLTKGGFDPVK